MSVLFRVAGPDGEPSASVLLVHGLGGHHFDTWRRGADKPWADDKTFWPLWLARDSNSLAVYVVGYEAPISRWLGTAMHLTDQATLILARLKAEQALARGPLFFIGHSLGGLLIKQVLRTANDEKNHVPESADLIDRVEKIAFLATPHAGAGSATYADWLRILVRPSAATASLVRNDPYLRNLNQWYRGFALDRSIDHLILVESEPTSIFGNIVQPDSADPGLKKEPVPVGTDYKGICKPVDKLDDPYVLLLDFIKRPVGRPKTFDGLVDAVDQRKTGRAVEARIERQTILELARQLNPREVHDFDQAVVELTAAVDKAVEVSEKGARSSDLGNLVDPVLASVAAKTRAGDIEGAARDADQGIAEWERAEAKRHAASVQRGIALLETGLEQDILRRDATAAARRVARIAALEHPDNASARFAAMRERYSRFLASGRDKGVNFDLLVAIGIARVALGSAQDAKQRGTAQHLLGVALTELGRRESGAARLEEAIAAYREALKERTRERKPDDWAETLHSLGVALKELGERESGTAPLEEAIAAYREALKERTRERRQAAW